MFIYSLLFCALFVIIYYYIYTYTYVYIYILLQAVHRTTDYMNIDTGVENRIYIYIYACIYVHIYIYRKANPLA